MKKSTRCRCPNKPRKPYPDFPLTAHNSGRWCKKIRGRVIFFGRWAHLVHGTLEPVPGDGWQEALACYQEQRDDLHAGRTPRLAADGLSVAELANRFLTGKRHLLDSGE